MAEPMSLRMSEFETKEKEKGYKPSRFNVRSTDKNGDLLLLNTYSSHLVKVEKDKINVIDDILRKPDEAIKDHPLFEKLVERGFIVPKHVDEFRRATLLHEETISGSDQLELILLPNEDCNFRCKYCYESFAKNFMKKEVQEGIINYISKNISKYKSLHVEWFGGEPLTAVPIIERLSNKMIDICKKHKVRYTAGMTTNGYNLTLKVFKKMLALRVLKYQISIDGLENTHDKQRVRADGKGTWNQIVKNLQEIRDNVKTSSFHIMLRTNISMPVLENIGNYADFLVKEFSNDHRFSAYWQTVGDWGGESVKNVSLCTATDIIPSIKEASDKGVDFSLFKNQLSAGGSVCYAARKNNIVVGSDGIIYKCTIAFDDEDNQIGMITRDGTLHIDRDKFALWVTGHESVDTNCQKCFFRPSCQGATCPLYRIKTNKSPCPPYKQYIKDYIRIAANNGKRVEQLVF